MSPIRDMLGETGITEQQWRVLRVLSEQGPMDASSLATKAALLFPSLTRIANTLREKDLVTQTRDKEDRRRQLVAITPAGQKIIDNNTEEASRIVAEFKTSLGPHNYEKLLNLLAMLDTRHRS